MNCQNHVERPATAYCRQCGKPVCDECRRNAAGTVYCAEHVPAPPPPPPPRPAAGPVPPPPVYAVPNPGPGSYPRPGNYAYSSASPGLAFLLGCIPGVGAIYNGQYAKGIVHAVVWGILMSMADSGMASDMQPVFIMLTICFWFYMAFEAYHTARKRRMGEPVDEYSSILSFGGSHIINVPVTGIALILLGVLLLLHTLDWVVFEQVKKYWPVLLIVAGAYLLAGRLAGPPERERRHERR